MRPDQTPRQVTTVPLAAPATSRPSRRLVLGSGAAAAAVVLVPGRALAAPSAPSAASAQTWAARAGAVWGRVSWAGRYHYAVPEAMTLTAASPGPVPAGAAITVQVDGAVVTSLRVVGAATSAQDGTPVRGSVRTSSRGGAVRLEWVLAEPLPAGASVVVRLDHVAARLTGPLAAVHHPVVEVAGGAGAAAQVATGRESVTRRDHVLDDSAVTAV